MDKDSIRIQFLIPLLVQR